jgi:DUF4097 and DUF4098 domain-containing protein YvlB
MTSIASLMLAGAVLSQTQAPAAPVAPVAPNAPSAPLAPEIEMELQTKQLEIQMKLFEKELVQQEFQVLILGKTMAKVMALQFPVPPVPPVPPRDPRQQPRQRDMRRVPEGWVESTEPFSRVFPVGKGATVMVSNIAGNIQVSAASGNRIEVEALKHAWAPNAEQAKKRLSDALVETFATGQRVEVRVEYGERREGRGIEVEFNVKVPPDTTVEVRTVSGDIRVTNVKGEVRAEAVSGNLSLEGTSRLAAVKTVSGGITITNGGADAPLSLSTVSGDLLVQTLNTRALDVNTVNGDVRIGGWSGDRAHVRTLDGDLDLETSLVKGGRYEIESHSGNVNVSLPEQPGFELEAHTFSGRIRIDFPIKSEGPIREGDRGPRSVRGTYGDGSSSLRVQTFSGNLTVTRR